MDPLLTIRYVNIALGVVAFGLCVAAIVRIPARRNRLWAGFHRLMWCVALFPIMCVYLTVNAMVSRVPLSLLSLAFLIPLVVLVQGVWLLIRQIPDFTKIGSLEPREFTARNTFQNGTRS